MIIIDIDLCHQVLTDSSPYGSARDGVIIIKVVKGERPPRPQNARWLQDPIWNMIQECWSEQRELRWNMCAVHRQFSDSSIQETVESTQGSRCVPQTSTRIEGAIPPPEIRVVAPNLNAVEDSLPRRREIMSGGQTSTLVEGNPDPCRQSTRSSP